MAKMIFEELEGGRWLLGVQPKQYLNKTIEHIYPRRPWLSRELNTAFRYAIKGRENFPSKHGEKAYDALAENNWAKLRSLVETQSMAPKIYRETGKYGDTYHTVFPGELELMSKGIIVSLLELDWLYGETQLQALKALSEDRASQFIFDYKDEYFGIEEVSCSPVDKEIPEKYRGDILTVRIAKLSDKIEAEEKAEKEGEIARKKAEIAKLQSEIDE